jgi:hypothetical protein
MDFVSPARERAHKVGNMDLSATHLVGRAYLQNLHRAPFRDRCKPEFPKDFAVQGLLP